MAPEDIDAIQWQVLEADACRIRPYVAIPDTLCDSLQFEMMSGPIVAALSNALETSSDDDALSLAVQVCACGLVHVR